MDSAMEVEEKLQIREKVGKPLLITGMVSIFMIFAALTSAYIVRQADGDWLTFDLPVPFYTSTVFIVLSSIAMWWATKSVKVNNQKGVSIGVGISLLLGIGFVISQIFTYVFMIETGLYFTGTNVSSSFLYVITGLHLAHIISGIIALIVSFINARAGKYTAESHLGLSLSAMYWHFLDVLWIYLLLFLLFIR
jgi:cytochrome c oxidase subunit 3